MPLYEYKCPSCGKEAEIFCAYKDKHKKHKCVKCDSSLRPKPSIFSPVTDTNFWYTGKYDKRLGSVVEGRKDWKNKLKQKGLVPCDTKDFAVKTTLEERVKKHCPELKL